MNRIERLIGRMTLAEKLGQMTMNAAGHTVTGPVIAGDSTDAIKAGTIGSLLNLIGAEPVRQMQRLAVEQSRLGIPLLFGLDVIHGHRSLFPIPLAETGLLDPQTWALTARQAALEAAADGIDVTFAPMLDVSRDPRWGRTAEGPGEDPWLAAQLARAKVRGFQGDDLASADCLAGVAKHYCAYGAVNAGRDYASTDISERTLREVHLPAFEAAVRAGVAAVMPAFTDLAGVPMTAHVPLLRHHLRDTLGFDGVVVSDYNAIAELLRHGVAADLAEAAALALAAGVDIDMMAGGYRQGLPVALERGLVTLDQIDESVRRVLRLKEQLGLFDDPYRRCARTEDAGTVAARRDLARSVAARSIVMLKNGRDVLPLAPTVRRVALIGPLADAAEEMRGPWWAAGVADNHVSVLRGLQQGLPGVQVRHAAGVAVEGGDDSGIVEAVALSRWADAVVMCLGEKATMSGEAASRAEPHLPGLQPLLARAVSEAAAERQIPLIVVLFSGRPLLVGELAMQADALLAAWFLGCEAGNALADVIAGRVSPSARTVITWSRSIGQVPIFFAQRPGGRPARADDHYTSKYLDVVNEPLFPFGHGLTYGRFTMAHLQVNPAQAGIDDQLQIRVDLTNQGTQAAEETVFLFVRDPVASVARPLLELRGFAKISLAPGQSGRVHLTLPVRELMFLGADLQARLEAGEVEILVGPSADPAGLLSTRVMLCA